MKLRSHGKMRKATGESHVFRVSLISDAAAPLPANFRGARQFWNIGTMWVGGALNRIQSNKAKEEVATDRTHGEEGSN